jgi:hypothetical protein
VCRHRGLHSRQAEVFGDRITDLRGMAVLHKGRRPRVRGRVPSENIENSFFDISPVTGVHQ